MTSPLWYLAGRSTRNRLARQFRRLRTPRYALALLLGLAYLWFVGIYQRSSSTPPELSAAALDLMAATGVLAVVAWVWVFGADRRALAFSRAEVTFLFPAPVTRRELVRYKLLRGQLVILFNTVLWTVLFTGGWGGTAPWRRALAIWTVLTTLALHRLGVALLRSSLAEYGVRAVRTRALTLVVFGGVAVACLLELREVLPTLRAGWELGFREFLAAAERAATRPIVAVVLLPARLLVRPLVTPDLVEWIQAMLPALAVLGLHYFWVVRSDAAFEESAAAAALTRGRRGPGTRAPKFTARRVPPLSQTGWPAGALLWKNLAAVVRTGRARGAVIGFAVAIVVIVTLSVANVATGLLEAAGWLAAMWVGFLLFLGPQWVRNDLRSDLSRLAMLRSYPLRGASVVAAETAGSTATLTLMQVGLLLVAYLALWGARVDDPDPQFRTLILAGAVAGLPAVNFLAMLIQNGAALLLPAWIRVGPERPIGVEALGQNMLVMTGFLLVLGVLLLVPAAAAAASFLALEPSIGWWAAAPAAAAGVTTIALEARLILSRLGRVFERTDPGAVPAVERA